MNIAIYDPELYLSCQIKLAKNKNNKVSVITNIESYASFSTIDNLGDTGASVYLYSGFKNLEKVIKENDVIINYSTSIESVKNKIIEDLCAKYNTIPINFPLKDVAQLECDRNYAKKISVKLGFNAFPESVVFTKAEQAINFLKSHRKESFVFKNVGFKNLISTFIPSSYEDAINTITSPAMNYFNLGGVEIESKLDGIEMCYGFFFDGKSIVNDMIFKNFEYKDAQEGDISGLQTGEVGSVAKWIKMDSIKKSNPRLYNILRNTEKLFIEKYPYYRGYVDLNTISNNDGIYLLEFTVRQGMPTGCYLHNFFSFDGYTELVKAVAGIENKLNIKDYSNKYLICGLLFKYGTPIVSYDSNIKFNSKVYIEPGMTSFNYVSGRFIKNDFYSINCTDPLLVYAMDSSYNRARSKYIVNSSKVKAVGYTIRKDIGYKKF